MPATMEESQTVTLLRIALMTRQAYVVADRTAKPKYEEYVRAKADARRRVRQLVSDLRWFRFGPSHHKFSQHKR